LPCGLWSPVNVVRITGCSAWSVAGELGPRWKSSSESGGRPPGPHRWSPVRPRPRRPGDARGADSAADRLVTVGVRVEDAVRQGDAAEALERAMILHHRVVLDRDPGPRSLPAAGAPFCPTKLLRKRSTVPLARTLPAVFARRRVRETSVVPSVALMPRPPLFSTRLSSRRSSQSRASIPATGVPITVTPMACAHAPGESFRQRIPIIRASSSGQRYSVQVKVAAASDRGNHDSNVRGGGRGRSMGGRSGGMNAVLSARVRTRCAWASGRLPFWSRSVRSRGGQSGRRKCE
jgi:hypothetical protein